MKKKFFFTFCLLITYFVSGLGQQRTITGTVKSEANNLPLPGVSVIVVEGNTGAITDLEGKFSIILPEDKDVLSFSFIGYTTQQVTITDQTVLEIIMIEDVLSLEEVVVVGYGTMRKSDLTGTISSVSTDEVAEVPNTNALQALNGRIPGFNVSSANYAGQNPESLGMMIRGINSLSASNQPLVVVDGIIYNGTINDFNPNDIEKIDVLKDASAAAVYGSRSANGVIIITSKMGKTEKPQFNFNAYWGRSTPTHLIPLLDGAGYAQKVLDYREAVGLESNPANITDYLDVIEAANYEQGREINWYDYVLQNGLAKNYNLNVSGRSAKTSYYLSGTYLDQQGVMLNDMFKRTSLVANFKNDITDWYSVSLRTAFGSRDYSGVEAGYFWGLSPWGQVYTDDTETQLMDFPMVDNYFENPLRKEEIDDREIRNTLRGTISSVLKVPFIEGLTWTMNYSTNLRTYVHDYFINNTLKDAQTTNGTAQKIRDESYDWTFDNIINYKKTFADIHSLDITLLYSREYSNWERTMARATDFFTQSMGYHNMGIAQVQQTSSDYSEMSGVAYMGRLNYIFNNKYFLTATVRRDGFSGFATEHKYAVFPSIAAGWNLSNESFMNGISGLDLLKIRLSYGENGNQALSPYQTLARIANEQYIFGDGSNTVPTVYVESMANGELGWETTKVKNLGVDFGILNGRVYGNLDIYHSNTFNILMERNIPILTGYNTVWTNIGKVENKGIELALGSVNVKKHDLSWESGLTFSLNRNKIISLRGEDLDGDGIEDDDLSSSWFIGEPLNVFYGYEVAGIYQTDDDIPSGFQAGDYRFTDVEPDGEVTVDDRKILGTMLPNYMFSISNTVNYKGFSLYVLLNSIQGGGKKNYYVGNNYGMYVGNYWFSSWTERFNIMDVPYWTPDRPSNKYARIDYMPSRGHSILEDRSFLRIQDITLSYTVPQRMLASIFVDGVKVYVSAKNLYTWTKWSGYDPELMTSIDGVPTLRTITAGVDIKF